MPSLGKRDVEELLANYDTDPIGALTRALSIVTGEMAAFEQLVESRFSPARAADLIAGDQRALDELAAELNERRTV